MNVPAGRTGKSTGDLSPFVPAAGTFAARRADAGVISRRTNGSTGPGPGNGRNHPAAARKGRSYGECRIEALMWVVPYSVIAAVIGSIAAIVIGASSRSYWPSINQIWLATLTSPQCLAAFPIFTPFMLILGSRNVSKSVGLRTLSIGLLIYDAAQVAISWSFTGGTMEDVLFEMPFNFPYVALLALGTGWTLFKRRPPVSR
jgi:hypothetical protein